MMPPSFVGQQRVALAARGEAGDVAGHEPFQGCGGVRRPWSGPGPCARHRTGRRRCGHVQCSASVPANCTGSDQPAKATMRRAEAAVQCVQRGVAERVGHGWLVRVVGQMAGCPVV